MTEKKRETAHKMSEEITEKQEKNLEKGSYFINKKKETLTLHSHRRFKQGFEI